jgi:hypothetical protein
MRFSTVVLSASLFFSCSAFAENAKCEKRTLVLPFANFESRNKTGDSLIYEYSSVARKDFWAELWKKTSIQEVSISKVVAKKETVLVLTSHTGEEYRFDKIRVETGIHENLKFNLMSPILNGKNGQQIALGIGEGDADIFGVTFKLDVSQISGEKCIH